VKDHLIPHLVEKPTAQVMWDTLKNLFEARNENRKMALKDKLHEVRMTKEENVATYLTRLAQLKDELAVVGKVNFDSEMVRITLKGFTKEWEVFVKCVVGREKLPTEVDYRMALPRSRSERDLKVNSRQILILMKMWPLL
jgi:hypothetical protein